MKGKEGEMAWVKATIMMSKRLNAMMIQFEEEKIKFESICLHKTPRITSFSPKSK